jgi:polysaccharide deacetylase 2 family uncharacterized protein YibQ
VKKLDRCIYDALLSLKVPARAVVFNWVETKKDGGDQWTYSDMEIRLQEPLQEELVRAVFADSLAGIIPEDSFLVRGDPQGEVIIHISVNGHPTHRVAFLTLPQERPPPPLKRLPKIAIIIDDLGYDDKIASKFLELDGVLTFSVLPHSPFQVEIASAIQQSGRDVLLHLPMEPLDYPHVDPGKGALMTSMTPDELLDQLKKDLAAVPYIVGVNNHMGSRLTQDGAKMGQVFAVLKSLDLFFVDSLTSSLSSCADVASNLHLKFARRQVFLDHVEEPDAIRFQIKRLVTFARTQGQAIGIGHPYPVTWEILREELPKIKEEFELVPVSEIVG